jgi:hypothetical protein
MKIKKLNEIAKFKDYIVVIYEDNEVGAGHWLYIVDTKDFDLNKEEESIYLNAIQDAILREDKYGYGGTDCEIMLHNIIQGDYGSTNVKEIKPPCKIDKAVYIWCNG